MFATSSGVPKRFNGIFSSSALSFAGSFSKFFVDRADVDDFPAGVFVSRTGRDAIFYEGLGNEKQSFEIDVQHSVEVRFGHVPEIGAAFESGIVYKHVDFAELCGGVGDKFLALADAADVVLKTGHFAPGLLN